MPGSSRGQTGGYALVVVIVVMSLVVVMAVGLLGLVSIERKTARGFVDVKRADWVARAGMEDVRATLGREMANDSYLVVTGSGDERAEDGEWEHLFVLQSRDTGEYEVVPLFSAVLRNTEIERLEEVPEIEWWVGDESVEIETEPWLEPADAAWVGLEDAEGRMVGRYAYVIEDMQSKLDAGHAHGGERDEWPWLVSGRDQQGGVQLAFSALETDAGAMKLGVADLAGLLSENREYLRSPKSVLGAMEFSGDLPRGNDGRLLDPLADVVERQVTAMTQPYAERPLVPWSEGLSAEVRGQPKMNLNAMLEMDRDVAVSEIADWIGRAMPSFDERAGGYPRDYLKSLAASMLDYADVDHDATVGSGYRGIDSYPLLSEVFLQIDFGGLELGEERKYLLWEFRLFIELWNASSKPTAGIFQVSYENGLTTDGIGVLPQGRRFDDPDLMDDAAQTQHDLVWANGRYWSQPQPISLAANEFGVYRVATVRHRMDAGSRSGTGSEFIEEFSLFADEGAAGMSQLWNGREMNRVEGMIRSSENLEFHAEETKITAEAAIPGLSYGSSGSFVNNVGDPRAAHDLRLMAVAENSYPRNASPGRRNIRRGSIYDDDDPTKPKIYGRVLPAEWPDGGHNAPVGDWDTGWSRAILPTSARMRGTLPNPQAEHAPQVISNRGWYLSATELGRIYDPIMWRPRYDDLPGDPGSGARDTASLLSRWPRFPAARNRWPSVSEKSVPSVVFAGGNSLRIGRPEHAKFDRADKHAARLLDLFHVGRVDSEEDAERRAGPVAWIDGRVNVNTASEDVVRTMLAGKLLRDPLVGHRVERKHAGVPWMAPPTQEEEVGPFSSSLVDDFARVVIEGGPYASAYDLAALKDEEGRAVWGNPEWFEQGEDMQWSDAASEEMFARVWNTATMRSRNFRVWVIGQVIAPHEPGDDGWRRDPVVLAESHKVFSLFADPGERDSAGAMEDETIDVKVLYENDF